MLLPELAPLVPLELRLVVVFEVKVDNAEVVVEVMGVAVLELNGIEVVIAGLADVVPAALNDDVVLDVLEIPLSVVFSHGVNQLYIELEELDIEDVDLLVVEGDIDELDVLAFLLWLLELCNENAEEVVDMAVVEETMLVVAGIEVVVEEFAQVPPGTFNTWPTRS